MLDPGLISDLEAGNVRILRKLDLSAFPHAREVEADFTYSTGLALDLETTGVDCDRHAIVQLGARTFWYDQHGRIVALGDPVQWLEDPGAPLPPEIVRLTGLTDADIAGKRIDEDALTSLVRTVDFVAAHNARFDRGFLDRRFPNLKNLPWACSCAEIDWAAHGFDGRGLGALLMQAGWFSGAGAHRADADVDSLIALLAHEFTDTGETALSELLKSAKRTTWRLSAEGACYDFKGALRDRGYRWNQRQYVWQFEVEDGELEAEKAWLAASIYAPRCRPAAQGPRVEKITWRERHG